MNLSELKEIEEGKVVKYIEEYKSYDDKELLALLKEIYTVTPKRIAIANILKERGYEHSDSN